MGRSKDKVKIDGVIGYQPIQEESPPLSETQAYARVFALWLALLVCVACVWTGFTGQLALLANYLFRALIRAIVQ